MASVGTQYSADKSRCRSVRGHIDLRDILGRMRFPSFRRGARDCRSSTCRDRERRAFRGRRRLGVRLQASRPMRSLCHRKVKCEVSIVRDDGSTGVPGTRSVRVDSTENWGFLLYHHRKPFGAWECSSTCSLTIGGCVDVTWAAQRAPSPLKFCWSKPAKMAWLLFGSSIDKIDIPGAKAPESDCLWRRFSETAPNSRNRQHPTTTLPFYSQLLPSRSTLQNVSKDSFSLPRSSRNIKSLTDTP
jgi:hypothetical protein